MKYHAFYLILLFTNAFGYFTWKESFVCKFLGNVKNFICLREIGVLIHHTLERNMGYIALARVLLIVGILNEINST